MGFCFWVVVCLLVLQELYEDVVVGYYLLFGFQVVVDGYVVVVVIIQCDVLLGEVVVGLGDVDEGQVFVIVQYG